MSRSVRQRTDGRGLPGERLVSPRDPGEGGPHPRGAPRRRHAGRGVPVRGAAGRQQESEAHHGNREGPGRRDRRRRRRRGRKGGSVMIRSSLPWMARASWTGGAFGVASAMVLIALLGLKALPALIAAVAIIAIGYLGGVLVAARTRLRETVRYVLRLRSELRLTQDYLMEQGSSRSLGVWLEAAGATLKGPLATLQSDARSLAADTSLPENTRAAAKSRSEERRVG